MKRLADNYDMPLMNIVVYNILRDNPAIVAKWNSVVSDPLITVGSHSYTHPQNWPSVPDALYESSNALTLQSQLIPPTKNYFNFSGDMNPTTAEIDRMHKAGVVFGGKGYDLRGFRDASGAWVSVQRIPTEIGWYNQLAASTSTRFCLSYTLAGDY
jgi:hypothetical protein